MMLSVNEDISADHNTRHSLLLRRKTKKEFSRSLSLESTSALKSLMQKCLKQDVEQEMNVEEIVDIANKYLGQELKLPPI